MSLFRRFERNTAGRDFVVGDIHGCFDRLRIALSRVNFDESRGDRLFSVGDLVDRGPSSHEAVDWLDYPWFHAVRGNHEQMAIDAQAGTIVEAAHFCNGGLWFYGLTDAQREWAARMFSELPLAIEVDTPAGIVGLVHAEVPGDDWAFFRDTLVAAESARPANFEHLERFALWGRDIIRGRSSFAGVANVSRVLVGHTPVTEWRVIGNVSYIDTGAVYGRPLTLVCLTDSTVLQVAA